MRYADDAVYTILNPTRLAELAAASKPARLRETRRWVAAKRLFDEARHHGLDMAILYADAANDCSRLIYQGTLKSIDVDTKGTSYTVIDLVPLEGQRTQNLVLRSTGANIAAGFIRPYAIVRAPSYISRAGASTTAANKPAPVGLTDKSTPTTLFSFGYWGAGCATPALVSAVAEAEALRGFEPPLWVDIRISRSVRAPGFRERAFEKLLGSNYLWMPDLGNVCVEQRRSGIEIRRPAAAMELIEEALQSPTRRVIFFCSCEIPGTCHRNVVARLVKKAGRKAGIDVSVVEWPGGTPVSTTIDVSPSVLNGVRRGAQKTLAVPKSMSFGEATLLPWASTATLRAGGEQTPVLLSPMQLRERGAYFKILVVNPTPGDAAADRKDNGYEPVA